MQNEHNEKQEGDDRSNKSDQEPLISSEKPPTYSDNWFLRNGTPLQKEYVAHGHEGEGCDLWDFDLNKHLSKCTRVFSEMWEKYRKLVWFARKPHPNVDPDFYNAMADDVREKVLKAQAEVIDLYPDEVESLEGPNGDWQHGFNTGARDAFIFANICLGGLGGIPDPIQEAMDHEPMGHVR